MTVQHCTSIATMNVTHSGEHPLLMDLRDHTGTPYTPQGPACPHHMIRCAFVPKQRNSGSTGWPGNSLRRDRHRHLHLVPLPRTPKLLLLRSKPRQHHRPPRVTTRQRNSRSSSRPGMYVRRDRHHHLHLVPLLRTPKPLLLVSKPRQHHRRLQVTMRQRNSRSMGRPGMSVHRDRHHHLHLVRLLRTPKPLLLVSEPQQHHHLLLLHEMMVPVHPTPVFCDLLLATS